MSTNTRTKSNRQTFLTAYRIGSGLVSLVALTVAIVTLVMVSNLASKVTEDSDAANHQVESTTVGALRWVPETNSCTAKGVVNSATKMDQRGNKLPDDSTDVGYTEFGFVTVNGRELTVRSLADSTVRPGDTFNAELECVAQDVDNDTGQVFLLRARI